ncbi:BrnA antitoxin family protein [candidate division WOR-3 bacterium]|nr:BrnA antitoxin family protein [candidate division WOR-3 bacterium]
MKKKTAYKNAPKNLSEAIIASKVIEDFLPAPENLVKKEETVKITILLSKKSIDFFKKKAKKTGVPYQTMIKTVLDKYTLHYKISE